MIEKIENDFLRVEVSSSGAELVSIYNKRNQSEYLWQANPQFWSRRAPVLFPVVGKLNNNQIRVEGNVYTMGQHGFARDQEFVLKNKSQDSLLYALSVNDHSLKVYPYRFELKISYLLQEHKLSVKYEVSNADEKTIYFSIGGHPAFNCPLFEHEALTDYYLEFEQKESANTLLLEAGLFTGNEMPVLKDSQTLQLSEALFNIDTLLFSNLKSTFVSLKSRKSDYVLKFDFSQFPFLAIWKKAEAPFVCIEPWEGHGDVRDFNGELKEKKGIVKLAQGSVYTAGFSIEIV